MSVGQGWARMTILLAVILLAGAATMVRPSQANWTEASITVSTSDAEAGVLQPPVDVACHNAGPFGGGVIADPYLTWSPPGSGPTPGKYLVTWRAGASGTPNHEVVTAREWAAEVPRPWFNSVDYYVTVQSAHGDNWTSQYYASTGYVIRWDGVWLTMKCQSTFPPGQPAWTY